jgi:hypothetical protein
VSDKTTTSLQVWTYPISEDTLNKLSDQYRSLLLVCMHAHNELSFLNRLLEVASAPVGEGELHDQAHSIQTWCIMQMLAGKLFETWLMLAKRRILQAKNPDPITASMYPEHQSSVAWLCSHFGRGESSSKENAIKLIRRKTAFHYDPLDLKQALNNLAPRENVIHLSDHPANTLYYMGSATVFRAIFALIADQMKPGTGTGRSFADRVEEGVDIAFKEVAEANWHIQLVLYGLIKALIEDALGPSPGRPTTIQGVPRLETVGLPPWLDMAST